MFQSTPWLEPTKPWHATSVGTDIATGGSISCADGTTAITDATGRPFASPPDTGIAGRPAVIESCTAHPCEAKPCLLYTSDAADES